MTEEKSKLVTIECGASCGRPLEINKYRYKQLKKLGQQVFYHLSCNSKRASKVWSGGYSK